MMRHVDLCSGIGGFALGFEWAGLSKPVLFCDIEPWSRKILAKHWPDVPIAEDVKELVNDPDGLIPDCDILTAGYPCQSFSIAGKQRGEKDDRHIWPEIFKIIQAKRPTWIVCENVVGHINLGLNKVLSDLESKANYRVQTFCIGAVSVNAPHRRQRIWIVAYSNDSGQSTSSGQGKNDWNQTRNDARWSSKIMADTSRVGYRGRSGQKCRNSERLVFSEEQGRSTVGSETKRCGALFGTGQGWEFEPDVGRVAHGIPRRVDRLRGLGNAIVPQIAQKIGETIKAVSL
tara:strand:+ start:2909 stop:3772 length:864 start_codon:yes stop_codon:yes gene_type:complete